MRSDKQNVFALIVVFLATFEVVTLVGLIVFPYLTIIPLASLEGEIFSLLAPLSPALLLGLLYGWIAKHGVRKLTRRSQNFNTKVRFLVGPFLPLFSRLESVNLNESAQAFSFLNHSRLVLLIATVSAFFLAFVPYHPDLNPTANLVGIDTPLYLSWTNQMLQRSTWGAVQYAFVGGLQGSRPAFLILLYSLVSLGIPPYQLIQWLPSAMGPLLVLSSYVFARSGGRRQGFAGLAAIFTVFSYYVTVGMWAGYYANWFALIESYLLFACLLRLADTPSFSKLGMMTVLSVALQLTHEWTWILVLAIAFVFAVTVWKETRSGLLVKSIVLLIFAGLVIDVLKSQLFGVRTLGADLATKVPQSFLAQVLGFWSELVYGLLFTHGGLFSNSILIALGLMSVLTLKFADRFERLLILWVGLASVPFAFLNSYHQMRILYDLPLPILASTGLLALFPLVGPRTLRSSGLLLLLVMAVIANYAMIAMLQL